MEISSNFHIPTNLPTGKNPVPIICEAGWTPACVCVFWRGEKSLTLTGIITPDRSTRSLIATLYAAQVPAVHLVVIQSSGLVPVTPRVTENRAIKLE